MPEASYSKDPKDAIRLALRYVKANIIPCCKELMNKSDTGILEKGCIRELATILGFEGNKPYALKMAEDMVRHEAVEIVSKMLEINGVDFIKLLQLKEKN